MLDYLVQVTLSNLMVASCLAFVAWVVQRRIRSASLVNLLWALVLIKMLTPPLFSIPFVAIPSVSMEANDRPLAGVNATGSILEWNSVFPGAEKVHTAALNTSVRIDKWLLPITDLQHQLVVVFFVTVLAGSLILSIVSLVRIVRFHRLLCANSRASDELTDSCSELSDQFGLQRTPQMVITRAMVAPFVWWMSGRAVVVVPEMATQTLEEHELGLVIAHEMAHIKRCDHWFRWLEWIAIILFWWNPVVWWARRQLRISEEIACDELVLETTSETKQYAKSLLRMAELLTTSAIRPPLVASAMNSGGSFEQRLKMIITAKACKVPHGMRMAILAVAFCVFPLGLVCGQEFEAVERRLGHAVHDGELSLEQANLMMQALKRSSSGNEREARDTDRRENSDRTVRRIVDALSEAGIQRESIRPTLEIIRKIHGKVLKQGNAFKFDEAMADYLSDELKLDREQIGLVVEISKRLANSDESDNEERSRMRSVVKRIKAAVDRGDMSKQEAEQKLTEYRIRAAVERGDLTEEEADRKREQNRQGSASDEDENAMSVKKRRYLSVVERVKDAVQRGDLSEDEARRKLVQTRQEMFSDEDDDDQEDENMEVLKRRYMSIVEKVNDAVRRGDLSKDEAKRKLIETRQEMSADDKEDIVVLKRRYMNVVERIKGAVDRGDLSEEQAESKLDEVKGELFGDDDD